MDTIKLRPQTLDAAAFAPFGRLISGDPRGEPDFRTEAGTEGWQVELQASKPLFMILKTPRSDLVVRQLERHFNVSQAFLPLGGGPAVLVAAKPTADLELPQPDSAAAFVLDGSVGYVLHVGTWHSLNRLPITRESTHWLMITDSDTQEDLANVPHAAARHTQLIELTEIWGRAIEILT